MMGMDILLTTVIKALGLKPEDITREWEIIRDQMLGRIKEFDLRLAQMEQRQIEIHAMLQKLTGPSATQDFVALQNAIAKNSAAQANHFISSIKE